MESKELLESLTLLNGSQNRSPNCPSVLFSAEPRPGESLVDAYERLEVGIDYLLSKSNLAITACPDKKMNSGFSSVFYYDSGKAHCRVSPNFVFIEKLLSDLSTSDLWVRAHSSPRRYSPAIGKPSSAMDKAALGAVTAISWAKGLSFLIRPFLLSQASLSEAQRQSGMIWSNGLAMADIAKIQLEFRDRLLPLEALDNFREKKQKNDNGNAAARHPSLK